MSRATVTAKIRQQSGKGPARRLRAEGRIPAVLYGADQDPVPLTIDPVLLVKALDPKLKRNTLLSVQVEDDEKASSLAMVKAFQKDPLKDTLIHVDFIRIKEGQEVDVQVPILFTGKSEGVKLGGMIEKVFRTLPIRVAAANIPSSIEVDTSQWKLNELFRVADLQLPGNATVLLDPKQTIASITMGREEEEEVKTDEEATAGEAEGAAVKEGADAPKKAS